MARRRLSNYFGTRYSTILCLYTGYYYFHDSENPDAETSWHKPRLAFPTDIQPFVYNDPEAYMKDAKYSQWDYAKGPFITRAGMTKGSTKRVKTIAFIKPNPWRDIALKDPSEIDLDITPIDSIIAWMDGEKAISLRIDEYARMKAAICGNNWELVLRFMRENPDNIFTQIYGLYSFSKSEIRLDIPEPGTHGNIMVDFVSTIPSNVIRLKSSHRCTTSPACTKCIYLPSCVECV
jgi:hypothetical protein